MATCSRSSYQQPLAADDGRIRDKAHTGSKGFSSGARVHTHFDRYPRSVEGECTQICGHLCTAISLESKSNESRANKASLIAKVSCRFFTTHFQGKTLSYLMHSDYVEIHNKVYCCRMVSKLQTTKLKASKFHNPP